MFSDIFGCSGWTCFLIAIVILVLVAVVVQCCCGIDVTGWISDCFTPSCGCEGFLRTKFAPAYRNVEGVFDYDPKAAAMRDLALSQQISNMTRDYYAGDPVCDVTIPDYTRSASSMFKRNTARMSTANPPNVTNLQYDSLEANGGTEVARRKMMKNIIKKGPKAKSILRDPNIMNKLSGTAYEIQPGAGVLANQRVNSLMAQPLNVHELKSIQGIKHMGEAFTINDKGYGNDEAFLPIQGTPALHTNSRVAGSSMSLESLGGTLFKKYDASKKFFTDGSGLPPELNIMKGKPLRMKYAAHPQM